MKLFRRRRKIQKQFQYHEVNDKLNALLDKQEKAKNRRVYRLDNHVYLPADVNLDDFILEFVTMVEAKGGMCPGGFREITDDV